VVSQQFAVGGSNLNTTADRLQQIADRPLPTDY